MLEFSLIVLMILFVTGSILLIVHCRPSREADNTRAVATWPGVAFPAVLFTLISCAAFVCFRVFYPLTPECSYWIEEDWCGRWSECPGSGLWGWLAVPVMVALLAAGIAVARTTVRRLTADGVFSSRRYIMTFLLTEGSMVIPLALYTALFSDHPFWWKSMLTAAGVWCWYRVIVMMVTVFSLESVWRDTYQDRKRYGRTTAVLGMLFAYTLLTFGGYELVRYQLGEYSGCPCELDGLVGVGITLIAASVAAAAAALVLAAIVKGIRSGADQIHEIASEE